MNPLHAEDLLAPGERLRTELGSLNRIKVQFQEVWRNCLGYFGLDPAAFAHYVMRPVTPFLVHGEIARGLVAHVERREGISFSEFFLQSNADPLRPRVTEFMLLQAFVLYRHARMEARYEYAPSRSITIFEPAAEDPLEFERLMRLAEETQPLFFAVHADARAIMTAGQWDSAMRYWQARGLIASREDLDAICQW